MSETSVDVSDVSQRLSEKQAFLLLHSNTLQIHSNALVIALVPSLVIPAH